MLSHFLNSDFVGTKPKDAAYAVTGENLKRYSVTFSIFYCCRNFQYFLLFNAALFLNGMPYKSRFKCNIGMPTNYCRQVTQRCWSEQNCRGPINSWSLKASNLRYSLLLTTAFCLSPSASQLLPATSCLLTTADTPSHTPPAHPFETHLLYSIHFRTPKSAGKKW